MTAEAAFQQLMGRQAVAALRISGTEQSHWNGRWYSMEGQSLGGAGWDGSLHYDKDKVIAPLRQMVYSAGQQQDWGTLQAYREAIQTMLHENSHMLSRRGEARADSAPVANDPHITSLEEGVAEAWSRAHVDDYIRELGLEQVAPGISGGTVGRDAYPEYTPAVNALCQGLGTEMGVTGDEVLRRLNNETAKSKWPAVADMVMDSSGLRQQIPPAEQGAARDRIQHAMQSQFSHLPTLADPSKPMDLHSYQNMRLASLAAGQNAIHQARLQVNALRQEYPVQPVTKAVGRAQVQGISPDMRQAMTAAQTGVAPMSGARPIGPAQHGDGGRQQQTDRSTHRTGPELGD